MLTTLVHSTDGQSEREEKFYSNLMKKLKKEIGEKNNASIKVIRQLLPLYKQPTEVSKNTQQHIWGFPTRRVSLVFKEECHYLR